MAKKHKRVVARVERQARGERDSQEQRLTAKELLEEELPDEMIPEVEEIEKDMGEMEMYHMGPTTWDESDALDAAREQAMKVNEVTYKTQDLVRNILYTPMMDEKSKAKAIQDVGAGFGERVAQAAKPIKKDLDILVIEAILAADKRHSKPLEFIGDFISKAKLTASAENALSDEQFALVTTSDGKKERKYPIHDKTHVRNALARAAQMMAEGGEAAADAKAAMPKIRAAAKKMGVEMGVEKSLMIEKDLNGDWRYVGSPTNNFIDFDSDILTKESHAEYAAWWEENQEFSPLFTTWHLPGMVRKSPADAVMEHEGFLIVSGILTEEEAEGLLKAQAVADIGMSHQSFALARDPNDKNIVTKYRMYEYSDLPVENAANPFTNGFEVISKEADMDKAKYLAQYMGEGTDEERLTKANAFLQKIGLKKEALEAAGIESKEKQEETPKVHPVPEPPIAQAQPPAAPVMDAEAILERLKKDLGVEQLNEMLIQLAETAEKVPVLEALIKETLANQEDKLAEKLTPPAERFIWMQKNRASQSAETVLDESKDEDKKLKERQPKTDWLSETLGVEPVQVQ